METIGMGNDLPKVTQIKMVKDLSPVLLSLSAQNC